MIETNFDKVVDLARVLPAEDQRRLRRLLDLWLARDRTPEHEAVLTEDELEEELLAEGVLDHVPPRPNRAAAEDRPLVPIQGKPLSETIIEERR